MSKYNNNNFPRAPAGDSPTRFNKRTRYANSSSSGGNSATRYKHQNQSGYQYNQNWNNATEPYQPNQNHFYGISPKEHNSGNQQLNKQPTNFFHNSTSSCLSPSSPFSASTQNFLNSPPTQPTPQPLPPSAAAAATSTTAQSCVKISHASNILDSSNYYGLNYNNFYVSNYNTDLNASVVINPSYGMTDGMTPFMWQTITSTPPPNLPHQQQQMPPLPPQQPPPTTLPPLPNNDNIPQFPPLPPIPTSITNINKKNHQETGSKTIVTMKAKRKAMSTRYKISKLWSEEDSLLALKAEETHPRKQQNDIILIIRFPDPEISREIVKCYSSDIESVHFQLSFAPRYCLVHLKPGSDVEKTIDHLSKIPFGTGFLSVEIKQIPSKTHSTKLNEVDPYTLYVGNLPTTIACKTLKDHFPGAQRIDIGFAQRMKYTRYAFVRFPNVQSAIEAYKRMLDAEIGGRTVTIRFRRRTVSNEGNKEGDVENADDLHDEVLSQTTPAAAAITSEDNVNKNNEITEPIETVQEKDAAHVENTNIESQNEKDKDSKHHSKESANDHILSEMSSSIKNNIGEANNCISTISSTISQAETSSNPIVNIKAEPDIDPDDIVIRDNAITSRFAVANNNIKREEEMALYTEFFEPPNENDTNRGNAKQSSSNDIVPLPSTGDETDTTSTVSFNSLGEFLKSTTSTVSVNSLGEFLKSCPQTVESENMNVGQQPPVKRNRGSSTAVLQNTIKSEPLENGNSETSQSLPIVTKDSASIGNIKQEPLDYTERSTQTNSIDVSGTVPSTKESVESSTPIPRRNSIRTRLNTHDNDDIVPTTALFFRTDPQETNSSNMCNYDEFYETSINVSSIKQEPFNISTNRNENQHISEQTQRQKETFNRSCDTNKSQRKDNINCMRSENRSFISSTVNDDEDDLVPAQNLLGSYRPLQCGIKREMEHDDIFSVPINKRNHSNECNIMESHLNINTNTIEATKTIVSQFDEPLHTNNDDVLFLSDNISLQPKQRNAKTPLTNNLLFHRRNDLVTIQPKPLPFPNRKVSKTLYHDNIDKLYEQLDADSDSDV